MRFIRGELTHVRFEPEIDGGTTYAFSYRASRLIVGRKRMHQTILEIGDGGCDLDRLVERLVSAGADSEELYPSRAALLADLFQLVGGQVLAVDSAAGAAVAERPGATS